jgi:hypothetical protein
VGALSVLSVQYETVRAGFDVPISYDGSLSRSSKPILLLVAEPVAVYRPRDPEQTAFYRLFDKHFDDYVYGHEERFEAKAGPFREVVRPSVEAFLDCGRPQGEFLPLPTRATYHLPNIEECFRQLLLSRLRRAERLCEAFMNKLLQWSPSGFSVHAEQLVFDDEPQKLEKLGSYLSGGGYNPL